MMFVDYHFHLLPGGSIAMDKELIADKIHAKDGDEFRISISEAGQVIFVKKQVNDGTEK